jgi:hypothetical protein
MPLLTPRSRHRSGGRHRAGGSSAARAVRAASADPAVHRATATELARVALQLRAVADELMALVAADAPPLVAADAPGRAPAATMLPDRARHRAPSYIALPVGAAICSILTVLAAGIFVWSLL